jgi:hypothetical protein
LLSLFGSLRQDIVAVAKSIIVATDHMRNISPVIFHPLQFPDKLLHHPWNLVTIELILSLILFTAGIHFPLILPPHSKLPQGLPRSTNLLNAGDSFAGISPLTSCYLFSRTKDLIAFV